MTIPDRSANILRNLERAQWKTTHELNYTGMGPSNTLNLDNYDEKMKTKAVTGMEDDTLVTVCIKLHGCV